jgi:hypothetical protein
MEGENGEKVTMWRVAPEVVDLVDSIRAEIAADPDLRAEVGMRNGKPTRAGVIRLLVTLGAKSLRGTIREKKKLEAAAAAAAATLATTTTTTKASKAPAGKGGRR